MSRRYLLFLTAMLACTVWSQPAPSDPAAEVLALEPKIEDAVVRGDVAFVDSVLAPDFSFVHGDGWTLGGKPLASDDKAAFLKRVADKEYLVHDLDGVKAEVHGDIVITYGRYLSLYMPKPQNAIPNATPGKLNSIWFERVYAKRNGQWQFADKRYKQGATTMGGRTMSQSASYVNLRVAVGRARGGFKTRISGGRTEATNFHCEAPDNINRFDPNLYPTAPGATPPGVLSTSCRSPGSALSNHSSWPL